MSVLVEGIGQHAYVIWSDGTCVHWDLSSFHAPRALEEIDLTPQGAEVTCAAFVAGKKTLLIGDDQGVCAPGSPPARAPTTHPCSFRGTWPGPEARVTALTPSPRARIVVAAYATGELRAFQSTLGEELLRLKADTSLRSRWHPSRCRLRAHSGRTALLGGGSRLPRGQPHCPVPPHLVRELPRAPRLAVLQCQRRLRAEARNDAARLRHGEGHALLDAVRGAPGDPGRHLHERVPEPGMRLRSSPLSS